MKIRGIVYFIILLLIVGLVIVWKKNYFSKEVLKLEILGPSDVVAGQKYSFLVKYKNNGDVTLQDAKIFFQCPSNSFLPEGKEMTEKEIDDIYPGQENNVSFECLIFGKEDEIKEAKAWVNFRPKNLKSRFEVENSYSFKISKIPVNIEIDLPSKIEEGKDFRFYIYYFSNGKEPISKLKIKAFFPTSFQLSYLSLPFSNENEWVIENLLPGEGGKIELQGKLTGAIGEIKTFNFGLYFLNKEQEMLIKEVAKRVMIEKANIFLRQEVNGNPSYVAQLGEMLHYEIFFKNIGTQPLEKITLICLLDGDGFDFDNLKLNSGYFKQGDNSIIFDWKDNPELRMLLPMDEGKVEFWVPVKKEGVKKPLLRNRVFFGSTKEDFEVKIASQVLVFQRGFYNDEIFGNTGPLPPQVGQETTYSVGWTIKNSFSDISNIKLRARLEKNVRFLPNRVFPEGESSNFFYDSQNNEIMWSLDKLNGNEEKTIYFQIAFTPSADQRNMVAPLISEINFEAYDAFSEKVLTGKGEALTTELKNGENLSEEFSKIR